MDGKLIETIYPATKPSKEATRATKAEIAMYNDTGIDAVCIAAAQLGMFGMLIALAILTGVMHA